MPRRRRPGAGAPKGNWNAVRTGNHSIRMRRVFAATMALPDKTYIGYILLAAGLWRSTPGHKNPIDRSVIAFLDKFWFDRSFAEQSKSINQRARELQERDRPRLEARRRALHERRQNAANEKTAKLKEQ